MTPAIDRTLPQDTASFWIVCCEETAVAQQLSDTIAEWEIPGVRSLIGADELAQMSANQADYAIFATASDRPCSQVQVSPLCHEQSASLSALAVFYAESPRSQASVLAASVAD